MIDTVAMLTSPSEWMIVAVVVLVLFGGSKIPELMRGLGSGMREFKKGLTEEEEEKAKAAAKAESDKKDA
jgi:sec-independent protein translocase protein TatA